MMAKRCVELFEDEDLARYIHAECCRHSRDKEIRENMRSEAWVWISLYAPDDMDLDTIKHYAAAAIHNEYHRELKQYQVVRELMKRKAAGYVAGELSEDAQPSYFRPSDRRKGAGHTPEPRKNPDWR
jgi:hypothetical protein